MKKSKAIATILVCIVGFALLCTLGYFLYSNGSFGDFSQKESETFSLYFLDSTKTKLVSEVCNIEPTDDDNKLINLVNLLIKGPKDSVEKKRAIPENTTLLSLTRDENVAIVNFSNAFYGATDIDNSLAAATIVMTLCDTKIVEKVKILVEGQELINSDKIAYGALGSDDIISDASQAKNTRVISLYFPTKFGNALQAEKRTVTQNDKEPIEKIAISELMKGSYSLNDGQKLIPAEAKLISTEIKDGVCFVNFSKEFVDKRTAGSSAELLTIYSIVNTLTELDNIDKVQFLIEGKKVETYGEMVFDEPFVKNEFLIVTNSQ